jgi:hypothetical protein
MRTPAWLTLVLVFSVGCGPSSAVLDEGDDLMEVSEAELRALASSELAGDLAFGQTVTVSHPGGPKYRALRFVAPVGAVDIWVRSTTDNAKAWLLASDFSTIARNDDASATVIDSHFSRRLLSGTFYIAFKEASSRAATFSVSLSSGETLDAGMPGPMPSPVLAPLPASATPRRIFVTHTAYDGDLKTVGGGVDGLDGADRLCAIAAISTNLGGTWKAFLSTSRVNAVDRIAEGGPWVNLAGGVVFNNKVGMAVGALRGIYFDERGMGNNGSVWTGTTRFLKLAMSLSQPATCGDWSSTRGDGLMGEAGGSDGRWTQNGNGVASCGNVAHLICIEQ